MRRDQFILGSTAFGLLAPLARAEYEYHKKLNNGSFNASLQSFSFNGKRPQATIDYLTTAFKKIGEKQDGTVVELMKDPEFQKQCELLGLTHLGGPMLGCISETGASIWVRTLKPSEVSVVVNGKTFGPVKSSVDSDLTAIVKIDGLAPNSENDYQVLIDGKPIKTASKTVIRTTNEKPAITRIAFGSCWHRWGLGHPMMDTVRKRKPIALLMIGDNAVQGRRGNLGGARFDILMRDQFPEWQRFCSEIPVFATWDDHDYGGNDLAGVRINHKLPFSAADRKNVRHLFTQSWVNPSYGLENQGVFLKTRIGPADVIMLDNRFFREPKMGHNAFLGKMQMDWLKKQLLESKAPFKIISCGTMWSDYLWNGKDSWGKFDKEGREEIFQFIEDHKISGVLLIFGDRHGARGFTIPRKSGYKFYEFNCASYGGRECVPAIGAGNKNQLYGMTGEYAYNEFEFDTTKADPTVTLRVTRDTGARIYETTLTKSQLTPM